MITADINKIYFIGIGGIGMSALARYFLWKGKTVAGYDKTSTDLTRELEAEGISITYSDSISSLMTDAELVVWTPAIPKDHKQFGYYKEQGILMYKRAEVLGMLTNSMYNICIAGSHGKTSTSSITSYLLHEAGKDVAAFLGGICINYDSNFLPGNTIAVAEADEFDRSFLQLNPDIALITAVDTDHLDIYGSFDKITEAFADFTRKIRSGGKVILNGCVPLSVNRSDAEVITYGLMDTSASYHLDNLDILEGVYHFDVVTPTGKLSGLQSGYGGRHNIENAIGAIAIAQALGVDDHSIREGLKKFKGVRRRFETHIRSKQFVYIDDYAHHPKEIEVTVSAARELYPGRALTVVFQPHLYSRTRDLAEGFAQSLSLADKVVLLDIYPAREEPISGVSSSLIYDTITCTKIMTAKENLLKILEDLDPDVLLTVGAGDIDTMVQPIIEKFKSRE